MLQTKEIFSESIFDDNLDENLNKFLRENNTLKIIDIKYNRVSSETKDYSSALVIYEEDKQK